MSESYRIALCLLSLVAIFVGASVLAGGRDD